MFSWDKKRTYWYQEAAKQSDFHANISSKLMPYIKGLKVCDLGCGLGYLSVEMAKYAEAVTAIDIDMNALSVLENHKEQLALDNLSIKCLDSNDLLPSDQWDAVVMCFFGKLTQANNLDRYLSHCGEYLISIVNSNKYSNFAPLGVSARKKDYIPDIKALLHKRGLSYDLIEVESDFGQPFSSKKEALEFIQYYSPNCTEEDALNHIEKYLRTSKTGGYYLPHPKANGIFIIYLKHPLSSR